MEELTVRNILFQTSAALIFCFSFLLAEGSTKISYQGVLTNDNGTLMTGIVDLSFAFYTGQTGGDPFCSLTHPGVDLGTQGVFSVNLDLSQCSGGVPAFDNTYYMGITVGSETLPNRIEITSAGYALNARHIQGESPNGNIFNAEGNVGIGDTTPDAKLDVAGNIMVGGSDNITPDDWGIGHLRVAGAGYTGYIALDETSMYVGHNSYDRDLTLQTDSQSRLTIQGNTGNVGIGTDDPDANLEVSSTQTATLRIAGDSNNESGETGDAVLQFTTDGQNTALDATIELENLGADTKLHFNVEDADVMTMHDGNVGIGTTTPGANLEVNFPLGSGSSASDDYGLLLNAANRRWKMTVGGKQATSEAHLQFLFKNHNETSFSDMLTLTHTGNVGIGTDDPRSALDVSGHINSSSFLGVYNNDYNIWIQGSETATGTPSDERNLALLGTSETYSSPDLLYLNYGSEYSGGTVIGGPVAIGSSPSSSYELYVSDDVLVADYLAASGGIHVGGTTDPQGNLIVATNVGIGDGTPDAKLDVAGNVLVDDYLAASGGIHVGGTSDPGADNLVVDGFTKLGSDAPAIKYYTEEGTVAYFDNLPGVIQPVYVSAPGSGKILSASAWIHDPQAYTSPWFPPDNNSSTHDYGMSLTSQRTSVMLGGIAEAFLGHDWIVTITYVE